MFNELIARISSCFYSLPDDEKPVFHRLTTYTNIQRQRIAAWLIIMTMSLVICLDLLYGAEKAQLPRSLEIIPLVREYINALRLTGVVISAIFLILTARISPDSIARRHHFIVLGFTFLNLLLFALINGLFQITKQDISSTYIMAVIISAAFLYLNGLEFVLIYFLSGFFMIVLFVRFQPDWLLSGAKCINVCIATIFAFMLSRAGYYVRIREYMRQRSIERQKDELAASNVMLYRLSYLDALTTIPNRRFFDDILSREWKRAVRDQDSLSLLIIDIDHFKQYNDTFGHQAGDDCLKQVAATLNRIVKRPGDIVARYGGEEFAAVLPNTDLEGACQIADSMCRAVRKLKIEHPHSPVGHLTVSIGLACERKNSRKSLEALIAAADCALYQAKEAGRNRFVRADD